MKASYICILAVFVTLVASDDPTECRTCWNIGQTECCPANTTTCPSGLCMTVSEHCTLYDKEYRSIRKSCGDNATCNGCFSVSTERGLTVRVSSQCATGNLSNDNLSYGIDCESLGKENGYQCDACYSNSTTDGCIPMGKVKCRGAETECVNYRGIIQLADGSIQPASVQGCVTKGGCLLGFGLLLGAKDIKQLELTCSDPELVPCTKRKSKRNLRA